MSVSNSVYPDLTESVFPTSVDSFDRFVDPDVNMLTAIRQYYSYINSGNITAAEAIIANNQLLKRAIVNAESLNKLRDSIIALERYYFSDIQDYIVNLVDYKGTWSVGTHYDKYNVVEYDRLSYMCISNETPTGTLPTNTTYWVAMFIKGASGTGLSPRGVYSGYATYYINDMVTFNNILWVCNQDNISGSIPSSSNANWWKLLEFDSSMFSYDNTTSNLNATDFQDAIDEVVAKIKSPINNLTSTSTTEPLSANMGRSLHEDLVDVENDVEDLKTDKLDAPQEVTNTGAVELELADNTEYSLTAVTSLSMIGDSTSSAHGFISFASSNPTVTITGFSAVDGDDITGALASTTWEFSCANGYCIFKEWSNQQ